MGFVSASVQHIDGSSSGTTLAHTVHGFHNHAYGTSATAIDLPRAQEHPLFYVGIYAAIGLSSGFVAILSTATQYTGALRASRKLFKQLLVSVVRATMRWHDTTPTGL
jgi:ABC-type multidrug transport system fused ATPase/permease subunit